MFVRLVAIGLLGSAACEAPPSATGPGQVDSPQCAGAMLFADHTHRSPDLERYPYGGEPGWNHVDKYGPGIGLGDLDGDRHLDLVMSRADRNTAALRTPVVFRGRGDGSFAFAAELPWAPEANGTGVLLFDGDGDGDLDIAIGRGYRQPILYRNLGDFAFEDISAESGLGSDTERTYTLAAGDVDRDGDLDLFTGAWRADEDEHGAGRAPNRIWLNRGDATFERFEVDVECGGAATLGQALVDLDGDGNLELYTANDYFLDCLHRGSDLVEVGAVAGIQSDAMHAMGVAVGDLDENGTLDLLVTDTEQSDPSLGNAAFLQREGGNLRFDSAAVDLGLDGIAALSADWFVGWGTGIEDFDGDGYTEVHIATHGEREELFLRRDRGVFVQDWDVAHRIGDADARGSAYGDIDGDGDIDIVVGRRGQPLQILENLADPENMLTVAFEDPIRAIGATVIVTAGGREQRRVLQAGSSYFSTSPPEAIFGLCTDQVADRVEAVLVGGERITRDRVPAGRLQL